MEGTISLGIFDANGKLVRVLDREAKIDSFEVDADSLNTTWDGKNDAGEDFPPGKYRARGYLVAEMKAEDVGKAAAPPPADSPDHISVKLVTNPLVSDTRSVVDLGVGFDAKGSFVKTMDGLPLRSVSEKPNLVRIFITKKTDKAAEVWQDDGSGFEQFRVPNIDKMMAFDCGDFELK
ncbi:MAG: FlgD Ig-like domain [Verrucomicrobiota bacterium]